MSKLKVGDEIEIKLRVKVIQKNPSISEFGNDAFLHVENVTEGIWETIYETIIIENDANFIIKRLEEND